MKIKVGTRCLLLISLLSLTACAGLVNKQAAQAPVTDEVVDQPAEDSADSEIAEIDPDIPLLDLDQQTLKDLLVHSFASYHGNWTQASESALLVAKRSGDYRLAQSATITALRARDYDLAAKSAELWFELKPNFEESGRHLFIAQVGAGNVEGAIQTLESQNYGSNASDLDQAIIKVSELVVQQRNGDSAVSVMSDFINKNPEAAQVYLSGAYVAEVFKKYDDAQSWLDQAMALKPGWDVAAQMKADILQSRGEQDKRDAFLEEYALSHPESVPMNINYATVLVRQERYQEAYDLMQTVTKRVPDDSAALFYTGALAGQLEDTDQAKKYFQQALNADPSNDDARWSLARLAAVNEKYVTAEKHFNEITSESRYLEAQIQVANMRYQIKGLKRALGTLNLLEPRTRNDFIRIALARHNLLLRDYQYEEALGHINEALLYSPDDYDLLYSRALVAAELKKVDIAEADLRAILNEDPDDADALNALGYTLADQTDRYEEARVMIARALEFRPEASHILDSMGWVLYRLQDYSGAIEFLQKAYDKNKEVEIAAHLGEVLWVSDEQEQAKLIWQEALNKDAENPVLKATLENFGVTLKAQKIKKEK